ncbi:hypothetical protein BV22DRAFT_347670 [Leucogyrophana mollusca]|uniref:Uncharacterized protein n=1 Tax=Leucogyrophana mollusca TaxID=85980 RepID=A0ACB8BNR8_9AGAM|nr:hypothetical protein BV22DRAFT_347670 [Leucogyrophana mollusca]
MACTLNCITSPRINTPATGDRLRQTCRLIPYHRPRSSHLSCLSKPAYPSDRLRHCPRFFFYKYIENDCTSGKFDINAHQLQIEANLHEIAHKVMVRGRKRDLTIPPTRALTQQRDYRARKAQYIYDLEERCRKAEEENVQLRQELAEARASLPGVPSPELTQASSELLSHLAAASASIARFQQVAYPHSAHTGSVSPRRRSAPPPLQPSTSSVSMTSHQRGLRPAFFSFPAPSPPQTSPCTPFPPQESREASLSHLRVNNRVVGVRAADPPILQPATCSSPTPSFGSECCGGLVDCTGLVEEEEEEPESHPPSPIARTSRLRFSDAHG